MTTKEKRRDHMRSLDDLEALKAREHLNHMNNEAKVRQDKHQHVVLETSKKAHQFVEQSKEGYDKHNIIFESLTDRRANNILKKNTVTEKK